DHGGGILPSGRTSLTCSSRSVSVSPASPQPELRGGRARYPRRSLFPLCPPLPLRCPSAAPPLSPLPASLLQQLLATCLGCVKRALPSTLPGAHRYCTPPKGHHAGGVSPCPHPPTYPPSAHRLGAAPPQACSRLVPHPLVPRPVTAVGNLR